MTTAGYAEREQQSAMQRATKPRLFAPAATRTDPTVVVFKCVGIADVAGVPQDLDAGQQLDVTGRPPPVVTMRARQFGAVYYWAMHGRGHA
jgi:hypothetical protein